MNYIIRRRNLGLSSVRKICEYSETGLRWIRNDLADVPYGAGYVFRWGCTASVPHGSKVINSSSGIHLVADKMEFRRILQNSNLCPKTWFTPSDVKFPAVVRPQYHHQGRNLCVVNNIYELRSVLSRPKFRNWYASELIDKVAEYRVFVVSGRAVMVAEKTPADPTAIAWNVARGGHFANLRWNDWPLKSVKVAIEAFALSKLDFGGVDIMVDGEGNCYVIEINSAPSMTSEYRQREFAKAFDYITIHGNSVIPLIDARAGYRKFIHPAVCPDALTRNDL